LTDPSTLMKVPVDTLMFSFKRKQLTGISRLKTDSRNKGFRQELVSRGTWDLLRDKRKYSRAGMALVLCVRTLKMVMDFTLVVTPVA
jgi:hypothetical protein